MKFSKLGLKLSVGYLVLVLVLGVVGWFLSQDTDWFKGILSIVVLFFAGWPWSLLARVQQGHNYPMLFFGPLLNAFLIYLIVWFVQSRILKERKED